MCPECIACGDATNNARDEEDDVDQCAYTRKCEYALNQHVNVFA